MLKPYIGITGFMSQSEVSAVLDVLPENSSRSLMVGVLASQKTIFRCERGKWPNRYPKAVDIASIFPNHPLALNLIHYNTKEPETLADQLDKITEDVGGEYLDGFQLNVTWPDPRALEQFRHDHQDMFIVLQIGHTAFDQVGSSPSALAKRVASDYLGLIEYVLLDPSGGLGKPIDPAEAFLYLDVLRDQQVEQFIWLGVAGGLSPLTLNLVEPLAGNFPELCIEGRLRDADDHLHLNTAKMYVSKALEVFCS